MININNKRKAIMICFVEKNYICTTSKISIKTWDNFANFLSNEHLSY